MDDRKKQIEELEKTKRENAAALDSLLERFGESLLSRLGEQEPDVDGAVSGEETEYRRLRKEIADSEAAILNAEEMIRRLKELEEQIELKEREDGERAKNLAGVYARLGKALFGLAGDGAYGEYTAPSREQAEALVTKIRSLEERLTELEQKEGSNVFAWIGKGAQGLVVRSFLIKARDNLEQLYRSTGERCSRRDNPAYGAVPPEITGLLTEIEQSREAARSLSADLAKLREERRGISERFGAEGGPLKHIQTLKNRIASAREELRVLYRLFGARAASLKEAEGADRSLVDALITGDDSSFLDEAGRINRATEDAVVAIEKLRASIAIDDEQAKIEKYRKLIERKRDRIAEAEKDIAEFNGSIHEAEKYIVELRKLL
ncbi:MAG: hypothetical protein LBS37_02020 [Treponema sp.]|jgi:chromosome segregation ATPase|nr:hypothetical protein [Treponema sp.]